MVEINLLPWRLYLKNKRQKMEKLEILFACLLAFSLVAVFHWLLLCQLKAVQARLSTQERSLAQVNKSLEEVRLLYQELDYQKLPDLDLNLIFDRQRQILAFLRQLAGRMPAAVYARQIHFDGQTWVIDGVSLVLSEVLRFADRLKAKGKSGDGNGALKKEKAVTIKQKNGLFNFQLRFEAGL